MEVADHGSRRQQGSELRKYPREDLKDKCADNDNYNGNAKTDNNDRHFRSSFARNTSSLPGQSARWKETFLETLREGGGGRCGGEGMKRPEFGQNIYVGKQGVKRLEVKYSENGRKSSKLGRVAAGIPSTLPFPNTKQTLFPAFPA